MCSFETLPQNEPENYEDSEKFIVFGKFVITKYSLRGITNTLDAYGVDFFVKYDQQDFTEDLFESEEYFIAVWDLLNILDKEKKILEYELYGMDLEGKEEENYREIYEAYMAVKGEILRKRNEIKRIFSKFYGNFLI